MGAAAREPLYVNNRVKWLTNFIFRSANRRRKPLLIRKQNEATNYCECHSHNTSYSPLMPRLSGEAARRGGMAYLEVKAAKANYLDGLCNGVQRCKTSSDFQKTDCVQMSSVLCN